MKDIESLFKDIADGVQAINLSVDPVTGRNPYVYFRNLCLSLYTLVTHGIMIFLLNLSCHLWLIFGDSSFFPSTDTDSENFPDHIASSTSRLRI